VRSAPFTLSHRNKTPLAETRLQDCQEIKHD
jgi:hypothetical protein